MTQRDKTASTITHPCRVHAYIDATSLRLCLFEQPLHFSFLSDIYQESRGFLKALCLPNLTRLIGCLFCIFEVDIGTYHMPHSTGCECESDRSANAAA
jgi:hypothetical protein